MRSLTRPLYWALTAALIAVNVAAAGCGKKQEEVREPVIRPVKTITVGGVASGEFVLPATVEAGEKALLSFRVSGRLIELPVEEGQTVEKGDLIARLDPVDFEIAVAEAQAMFTKAESDHRRYQQLYEKNAVPLSDLELRRSQRDVTKAKLDEARQNLQYTYLRAPFGGQIGRRYVENYMDVNAQDEIVDLNDVNNVEIIVNVAENLMKVVRQGAVSESFSVFDAAPGIDFPLEVKEVANRADPETQTFRVTFSMPQPDEFNLLPGMTAEVKIVITQVVQDVEVQTISIPAVAVLSDEDGDNFVYVVDKASMTVKKQIVEVGRMSGLEDILILDGLAGGETIVVAGLTKLRDGMRVRLWDEQDR